MWEELKSVFDYWIAQGVTIFRVDNPHTKAFPFWEWVIGEIKRDHPEVLFWPKPLRGPRSCTGWPSLASASPTPTFHGAMAKARSTAYLTELAQTPVREFFRPNQWPNTPDILTEFLQIGGRAVFGIRLLLAATLGANYGIYGPAFELLEHEPVRRGSEEYLNSEKYEIRHWDLDAPGELAPADCAREQHPQQNDALQSDWSLKFHSTDNDQLICYTRSPRTAATLILDCGESRSASHAERAFVTLPAGKFELGQIPQDRGYEAEDLLTGDALPVERAAQLCGEAVVHYNF
jgi:starch synthase (maltosyl-transferring)